MKILKTIIKRIIQILLILNAILWLPLIIFGAEKDTMFSVTLYLFFTVPPFILFFVIKALYAKFIVTNKDKQGIIPDNCYLHTNNSINKPTVYNSSNIDAQINNFDTVSSRNKTLTPTSFIDKELLPKEFRNFSSIIDGKLFVRKCSLIDFYLYIFFYIIIFILFLMMSLSTGGAIGFILIVFVGALLLCGLILTIVPLYFPFVTKIDFSNCKVFMKSALIFSTWKTYTFAGDEDKLITTEESNYRVKGPDIYNCNVILNIKGKSFCIKHFSNFYQKIAYQQASEFADCLRKGFKNRKLPWLVSGDSI